MDQSQSQRKAQWTLGLILLSFVVILWVLSSFLVNDLFEKEIYAKPFLITYLNTTTFIFYLVPFIGPYYRYLRASRYGQESHHHQAAALSQQQALLSPEQPKLSFNATVKLALQFCVLWYLSNLATNASLRYTSVSSQTILSSTASFFTLVIGVICKVEHFNKRKLYGLILSMFGIVIVNKFDFNGGGSIVVDNNRVMFGNFLALASAAGYGIYSILLKLKVQDDSMMNFKLFFGFVGVFNLIILWIPLIFLHYMGIEKLEWPDSNNAPYVIKVLLINGLITFVSDFFWAKAMILTSPLTTTVGLSLTIPLAMFGDFFIKREEITALYVLGAVVIGGSFIIINNDEEMEFGA